LYDGGNMMKGMVQHWTDHGMLSISAVQRLLKQIFASIAWLHSRNAVHRDVKGDNYVMDHPDVAGRDNKVYLADFGTVRELLPGDRFKQACGTKQYWSPEFFALNYGFKVDVWAAGVVMYGLFTGKFAFKSHSEVLRKQLQLPSRVPSDAKHLLSMAFQRDEEKRCDARGALEHEHLKSNAEAGQSFVVPGEDTPEMGEYGANAGIAERRLVLVDRLQQAQEGKAQGVTMTMVTRDQNHFTVQDRVSNRSVAYEWWSGNQAKEVAAVADAGKLQTEEQSMCNVDVTRQSIVTLLENHRISLDSFGKGSAKPFDEFVKEIQEGRSRLLIDATRYKSLVRTVETTLICVELVTGDFRKYLVETGFTYQDGRGKQGKFQLPGIKRQPHKNRRQMVNVLCEFLQLGDVQFDFETVQRTEEDHESPSFPGIRTVYRKEMVKGRLRVMDEDVLKKLNALDDSPFTVQGVEEYPISYRWITEEECKENSVQLDLVAQEGGFSALVPPPVGLDEEALNNYLVDSKVPLAKWGEGNFKTLSEFSEELNKGEAALLKQKDGTLCRVVDIVVLIIKRGDEVLVEAKETHDDKTTTRNRLPALKRRPDEHPFLCARRLVAELMIPNDNVEVDPASIRIIDETQESASYAGMTTLYRKRFMTAAWK